MIEVYTDGSHLDKQNNGRLGCGGVMVDGFKKIDEFSQELTPDWLKKNYRTDKVSNPTAEMLGVLIALRNFDFPKEGDVTFRCDYIGVPSWLLGKWRVKEPYLQAIKNDIEYEIRRKGLVGRIHFEWVKAHQKSATREAYWNNYVDLLAKGLGG